MERQQTQLPESYYLVHMIGERFPRKNREICFLGYCSTRHSITTQLVFDKLNDFTGSIPASFENAIAAINVQYNNLGAIYRSIYKSTADYVTSRHNYLALNMPWYRDFRDGNLTPEAIKFFTEGHVYENWVAQFVRDNLYQKYGILHSYMAGSLSSLILINQSLDITGDQQINAHITPSNSTSVDYAGIYEPKNGASPIIVNIINDYLFIENLVYEQVNDSTFQSYTYGIKIYFRYKNEKSPTTLTYNDLYGSLEALKKE